MKWLFRSRLAQNLLPILLQRYLWLVLHTTRWTLDGAENVAPLIAGAPGVVAFWHEYLPAMPALAMLARGAPASRLPPLHALVSQHRDGQYIGAVLHRFRIEPVGGSSSRGGAAGSRRLLQLLGQGAVVCIAPDGPRGPRRVSAPGLAQIAAFANVAVLPCAAGTTRRVTLKSWDRMTIPLPFGRGFVVCGPRVPVSREAWREALPALDAGLNGVSDRLARLCGRN